MLITVHLVPALSEMRANVNGQGWTKKSARCLILKKFVTCGLLLCCTRSVEVGGGGGGGGWWWWL